MCRLDQPTTLTWLVGLFLFWRHALKTYIVERVLNNNAVIASQSKIDYLLMGLSIGWGKHIGDSIDSDAVERFYVLHDSSLYQRLDQLFEQIPNDVIQFSMELVTLIKSSMGYQLSDNLYTTIPDHINNAITQYRNDIHVKNMMLWDVKSFFTKEFEVGAMVVEAVNKHFDVKLGEDEAAFIALHIVNASHEVPDGSALAIIRFITRMVAETEHLIHRSLDRDSLAFFRYVTHLKYLGRRIITTSGKANNKSDSASHDLLVLFRENYTRPYSYARQLCNFIEQEYGFSCDESDLLYLIIHVQKLLGALTDSGGDA